MQKSGFNGDQSLNKLDEIDISYIEKYGFKKERYPFSMGKTYLYFCAENHKEINLEVKKKIEDIGWQVFRQVPELVDGAVSVLQLLRENYFLILATMGDPQVQEEKIRLTGLDQFFSDIHILKLKNVEEYLAIIMKHQLKKAETWLVGNSVRSDLNPGLKLGLNCILIPYLSWKFEDEKPISSDYIEVKCLKDILPYL